MAALREGISPPRSVRTMLIATRIRAAPAGSTALIRSLIHISRADMGRFFGGRVNLKLWVKVKEDWRNRESVLRTLGYDKTDFNL